MASLVPKMLPDVQAFGRLSARKQRKCLQDALGAFVDALQVEGRDPRQYEVLRFQSAMEALGEGNLGQAYEDALALQRHVPALDDDIAISGQLLSRNELAVGLRSLVERLQDKGLRR